MIRVCIVAPRYMTGGQAIEARTLVEGFAGDPEVRVELQPIDPRLPAGSRGCGGVRTVARMPLFLVGLARRVWRADVVHVFTAAFSPFLLTTTPAILLARAAGPARDPQLPGRPRRDHIRPARVRWVFRRATLLVFPSGFLRDVFRRFGLEGEVVPNVVDTERFRFRAARPAAARADLCRDCWRSCTRWRTRIRAFARVRRSGRRRA